MLVDVSRNGEAAGVDVDEEYSCNSSGMVKVTIWNRSACYRREYTLGKWSDAGPRAGEVSAGKRERRRLHRS